MAKSENVHAIEEIRGELRQHLGKLVHVRADQGRKRVIERQGVLEEVYPHLFIVQLDERHHNRRLSFTYADVLTGMVEVSRLEEDGRPVFAAT